VSSAECKCPLAEATSSLDISDAVLSADLVSILIGALSTTAPCEYWLHYVITGCPGWILVAPCWYWLHCVTTGCPGWVLVAPCWYWLHCVTTGSPGWVLVALCGYWLHCVTTGSPGWVLVALCEYWLHCVTTGYTGWLLVASFGYCLHCLVTVIVNCPLACCVCVDAMLTWAVVSTVRDCELPLSMLCVLMQC